MNAGDSKRNFVPPGRLPGPQPFQHSARWSGTLPLRAGLQWDEPRPRSSNDQSFGDQLLIYGMAQAVLFGIGMIVVLVTPLATSPIPFGSRRGERASRGVCRLEDRPAHAGAASTASVASSASQPRTDYMAEIPPSTFSSMPVTNLLIGAAHQNHIGDIVRIARMPGLPKSFRASSSPSISLVRSRIGVLMKPDGPSCSGSGRPSWRNAARSISTYGVRPPWRCYRRYSCRSR